MANANIDRRFIPLDRAELRAIPVEGQESPTVEGFAVVYNSLSEDLGGFREVIAPGAFDKSLETADLRAFYGHDTKAVLGRMKSGTLKVSNEARGLKVSIDLPDTTVGRDVQVSLGRGDIDGMSFAMIPTKEDWSATGGLVRTIREAQIFEVSIVSIPAYSATSVSLRSLEKAKEMMRHSKTEMEVLQRRLKLLGY